MPTLRVADLTDADTAVSDFTGASLIGANLTNARLAGANLTSANLRGANLEEANLSMADLSGARLTGANLQKVKLAGVQLKGADFSGADLQFAVGPVNFDNAICSNTKHRLKAKTPSAPQLCRSVLSIRNPMPASKEEPLTEEQKARMQVEFLMNYGAAERLRRQKRGR